MFACLMIIAARVIKSHATLIEVATKLPIFSLKCFYHINAVKGRLCLCIGLS